MTNKHRISPLYAAIVAAVCAVAPATHAEPLTIKFATIAPEGTTWVNVMRKAARDIKTATQNRVDIKIFPGGVKGDEPTMVKLLRTGKIQGAGFTGIGLGEIVPMVRILEIPLMFKSYKEADYVTSRIQPRLEEELAKKGFVLMGWGEAGFVHIYSNKPIKTMADFKGVRMWAWEGDPLSKAMVETYGIVPTYLSLPDVLTALQTNRIDAVYAPPIACVALQWHSKVKFMGSLPLADSAGAFILAKSVYDQIKPEDQKVFMEISRKAGEEIVQWTRKENLRVVKEIFPQNNIQITEMDPAAVPEVQATAVKVQDKLAGVLYPKAMLDEVRKYVAEFRAGAK